MGLVMFVFTRVCKLIDKLENYVVQTYTNKLMVCKPTTRELEVLQWKLKNRAYVEVGSGVTSLLN